MVTWGLQSFLCDVLSASYIVSIIFHLCWVKMCFPRSHRVLKISVFTYIKHFWAVFLCCVRSNVRTKNTGKIFSLQLCFSWWKLWICLSFPDHYIVLFLFLPVSSTFELPVQLLKTGIINMFPLWLKKSFIIFHKALKLRVNFSNRNNLQ